MRPDSQGPDPLVLEHLTWPEVELALTRGTTGVVIPVGSVEQHGPHLPLMVDAERGTAIGRRVAQSLGDTLLGPTIRVGCSEHHMGFAGTVSIRPETLEAICRDYCVSLARHGFRDIYLVPSHGGNFQPLAEMVPRIQEAVDEVAADTRVVAYTDLLAIVAVWRWVVEEEAGLGRRVGGHADIAESSEMLHLHPGLVRAERVEKGAVGVLDQEAVDRIFEKGLRAITPNGILGDPRGMDAGLGERLLDATARVMVQAFEEEDPGGSTPPGGDSRSSALTGPAAEGPELDELAFEDAASVVLDDEEEAVEDDEVDTEHDDEYGAFERQGLGGNDGGSDAVLDEGYEEDELRDASEFGDAVDPGEDDERAT